MSNRHASIAILPFENLSGSPDDARLAGGFVQDLIAELARFPSIGVIAAESTFAVESAGLDDEGLGQRLGVEYLLKGSVRRAAKISASMCISCSSPPGSISGPSATMCRRRRSSPCRMRSRRKSPTPSRCGSTRACCWPRGGGSSRISPLTNAGCAAWSASSAAPSASDEEARAFFEQALAVDPHFARAHAGLSLSHFNEWSCQAWGCWEEKQRLAYEHAQQAEALDPDDPLVQVILAKIEQYRRQHGAGGGALPARAAPRAERRLRVHPARVRVCVARRRRAGDRSGRTRAGAESALPELVVLLRVGAVFRAAQL